MTTAVRSEWGVDGSKRTRTCYYAGTGDAGSTRALRVNIGSYPVLLVPRAVSTSYPPNRPDSAVTPVRME